MTSNGIFRRSVFPQKYSINSSDDQVGSVAVQGIRVVIAVCDLSPCGSTSHSESKAINC
jgi:hypothetical protein